MVVGEAGSFIRAMRQSQGALGGFGRTLGMMAAGAIASGGAAIAGLGVLSAKAAIDFESSFAGIRKTVDATEPQFEALQKGIRKMAKEIPEGVNQLNEIGEMAGQLGIKRKGMLSFIRTIADLGETTNLVGEEAASTMAKLANVMQLPQRHIRNLGSTIVALGNAGASTERDIADFGLRIAGAGKIAGLSAPQVLAIGNAFTSVGVEAEAGGTAVSKVLLNMNTAVLSGGKQLEGFAKIAGQSAAEFRRSFQDDAGAAFTSFVEGLDRITKEGGNAAGALKELGLTDQRLLRAFLGAAGAGDILRESIELGTKAWKDNTALTVEAEKRYKTTASQLQILRNRWTDLKITIGERILPVLNDAIKGIVRLAERVGAEATIRGKINIIWEAAKTEVGNLFESIKGAVEDAVLGPEKTITIEAENPLFVTFPSVEVTERDRSWADAFRDAFNRASAETAVGFDAVDAKMEAGLQRLADRFNAWATGIPGRVVGGIRSRMNEGTAAGDQLAKRILDGAVSGLAPIGGRISAQVSAGVARIRGLTGAAFSAAVTLGGRVVAGVSSGLGPLVGAVTGKLNGIIQAIFRVAGNAFSAAVGIGGAIVRGVLSGLAGLAGAVKAKVDSAISWALNKIDVRGGSPPESAGAHLIGEPIARGVIRGWVTGTRDLPEKMSETLRKAIDKAVGVVQAARDKFSRAFDDMASRILRAFDAQTSGHKTATEQLLAEQEERRRMEDLIQRQAEAQANLNKLIAEGGAAEEVAKAQRDLARATEDVARPALEAQAAAERTQFESQREELRLHLEKRLEALEAHWQKVGVRSQKAINQLNALLLKVGLTDFTDAGEQIGNAFVKALLKAIKAAVGAGGSITNAINAATAGIAAPGTSAPALVPAMAAAPVMVNVTVEGNVTAEQDLAQTIRTEIERTNILNGRGPI